MSNAASDHACPHLREQSRTEAKPVPVPARGGECPFTGGRAASEPLRAASATMAAIGGWWAFCSQADTAEARA